MHYAETTRTSIRSLHYAETTRTSIRLLHYAETTRTSIRPLHYAETSRTSIRPLHYAETTLTSIRSLHYAETTLTSIRSSKLIFLLTISVHYCLVIHTRICLHFHQSQPNPFQFQRPLTSKKKSFMFWKILFFCTNCRLSCVSPA